MNSAFDPYAALGLKADCTVEQVASAYRDLVKRWHPDRNAGSAESLARTRELNAAYEILADPARRAEHDRRRNESAPRVSRAGRSVNHDVRLRAEDFLRGASFTVRFHDPANPDGPETYGLVVPAGTPPGARLRLPRAGAMAGGVVVVRLRLAPGRFTARGSDLRCDLRISVARAVAGGAERIPGPAGGLVRVDVPAGIARNAVVRVAGEGLPRLRGGRGDLLVRITYRPEVSVRRGAPAREGGWRRLR